MRYLWEVKGLGQNGTVMADHGDGTEEIAVTNIGPQLVIYV